MNNNIMQILHIIAPILFGIMLYYIGSYVVHHSKQIFRFKYNMAVRERERIIFNEEYHSEKHNDGYRIFNSISYEQLQTLLHEKFANPKMRSGNSPTIAKLAKYGKKHPGITYDGYAIDSCRDDYGVIITSVNLNPNARADTINDFISKFKNADVFTVDKKSVKAEWRS